MPRKTPKNRQRVMSFGPGGRRPGAGRPIERRKNKIVLHRSRPEFRKNTPCHITIRVRRDIANLRARKRSQVIRRSLTRACKKPGFRIVDWSILGNHLHLIVEADGRKELGKGMQGFGISVAKSLNALARRKGAVFTERYHLTLLRTPSQVRQARAYVIANYRKHCAERREKLPRGFIDGENSSWAWFDGWKDLPASMHKKAKKERAGPPLAASPQGWLLKTGWKRRGLVSIHETPAVTTQRR